MPPDLTPPEPPLPRWRLGPRGRVWFDALLVVALATPIASFPLVGLTAVTVVLALAQVLPLLWRRERPVGSFAVIAAASALQAVAIDVPLWSQVAFPVATYSVVRYAKPVWGWVALGVGLAGAVVAGLDWTASYAGSRTAALPTMLTVATIVVASWALAMAGRTRQAYVDALVERGHRLAHEAAQQAELAAADERARIAREMHDVVAHGLSVIVVQADGARYAAAQDPSAATTALATISATGREALDEMRRMLGVLRAGPQAATGTRPQPRLGDLAGLVEEARAAGLPVLAELPEPAADVPDGAALTAYRVVQEALTNVRKHAGRGASVALRVHVAPEALDVLVEDDGAGPAAADDGRGLGLLGMRERVASHGGTLDAGPRPGRGFRVAARIPL
ncbi:sensor histidine kinase [Nocardioides caldifontis]|uniref:sensor histidine kinase n=1 Tax=Nocardioides caldifontis TaxID=2588938 RepID=UPI0011DFE6C9|nr:sensor histidine kinase [Nocardioides caldifontis]